MRSIQLEDIRNAADRRSVLSESIANQVVEAWDRTRESESRSTSTETDHDRFDRSALDITIGCFSLFLGLIAWRRDRSKSRRELLDAAIFVSLGVLERYVIGRQR